MHTTLRWGIFGTGNIAARFVNALAQVPGNRVVAVASRTQQRAQQFAARHKIPFACSEYSQLVHSQEVDIVYIATPNATHCRLSLLCLEADKHVLCEKPVAVSRQEASLVISRAQQKGLFFMEGMWSRFLPSWKQLAEDLRGGVIGEVRAVYANFGYCAPVDENDIVFSHPLQGGALLDVGVYGISFASMVLAAQPKTVRAVMHMGSTMVDEHTAAIIQYEDGTAATIEAAIRANMPCDAYVYGTQGYIHLPAFYQAQGYTVHFPDGRQKTVNTPFAQDGFVFEIQAVQECIANGRTQCCEVPHRESLAEMEMVDAIRSSAQR